ncbi:AMP-binding protein [Actinomadura decatromicini]|uniref:AMP-binding protein n=1 Tax=Actinomadura decatromicini TaxID=2604572 RepID=UPI001FEA7DD7|nr:AMP-binding protein [Actinomadura decatromicini]
MTAAPPDGGRTAVRIAGGLGGLLRARAEADGDRVLFRFAGTETTVARVEDLTNRLADVLAAHGVRRGDRVAVMLDNGVGFPVAWLAIAKLGAVIVPVNPGYRSADLAHVVRDSGAVLALAGTAAAAEALLALEFGEVGLLDPADAGPAPEAARAAGAFDAGAETAEVSGARELPDISWDDLVNLQYTSGTTGFPKGCMLTHRYWLHLAELAADIASVTTDDVDLTAQPFYYMDPQWNTVLCLLTGIPLVILPRFSASGFWPSVREHGATFFYVLGTMPLLLLKQPPDPELDRSHRVRLVLCSGITPALHATIEERWGAPWREAYGSTEAGVVLAVPPEDTACVGTGAMGRPVPGKEAKIVREDGTDAADGEVGEIVARGEPTLTGYWNRDEPLFRDGWYPMGDLGYRDERGHYHLVGRLKEMIRRGSENIAAAEVEAVLTGHPAVRAAAVVPVPDDLFGEEVKAFVQPAGPVEPGELVAYVRARLADFKTPRFVEFVEEFPMTPSERIAKHLLPAGRDGAYDAREGTR